MRDTRSSTVERAYALARSGQCRTLTEIRDRLRVEGHIDAPAHLSGVTLPAELRRLIVVARSES